MGDPITTREIFTHTNENGIYKLCEVVREHVVDDGDKWYWVEYGNDSDGFIIIGGTVGYSAAEFGDINDALDYWNKCVEGDGENPNIWLEMLEVGRCYYGTIG